ncbi:MAG: aspartate aminotransferase family protein [Intestinibacter sp.]|uniref:aspartate aminotransferase family protein n=1 Tax=Intestinibacter sp. TaxID=1965304 RepID=UPI002A7EF550|nr:aspartate aminotransferase family protein [Intestinibacter sp.]MDY4575017.1 aspartate aminotransferase family protein [Intestinibacter sp.]
MELTPNTQKIQDKWDANFMKTYAQVPVVIDKGQGATVTDIDGKEYVDFTSGIGVSALGYGHPELTKAIQEQAAKLLHSSNIFFNEPHVNAGEKIIKLSGYDKAFFCNSGTEANEGAMKIARKYSDLKYGGDRGTVLSLNKSFHGRTMASLMATGKEAYHKYFYPLPTGYKYVDKNDIEAFKEALKDETICAFIFEAVQGEGGVYPVDKEFIEEAVKLCQEKDIIVICDEVQAGMGRTGKLFGFQNFDIKPDLVTMAKGLAGGIPVGGILANEKVSNVLVPGDHGTTFGGNALAMAAANVVLDELAKPEFLDDVAKKGQYIMDTIKSWNLDEIVEVRGKGLMIGVEIKGKSADVEKAAAEKGLLVLTAGEHVVRLLPPLVISMDEISKGLEVLKACL